MSENSVVMMNGTGSVSPKLVEPSVKLTNGHSKEVGVAHAHTLVESQVHGIPEAH